MHAVVRSAHAENIRRKEEEKNEKLGKEKKKKAEEDEMLRQEEILKNAEKSKGSLKEKEKVLAENEKENTILAGTKRATISDTRELCFFCGNLHHVHSNCPARNAECRKCMKRGHWAKVYKSQVSAAVGNEGTRSSPDLP